MKQASVVEQRYKTLEEFWPFYVREHRKPLTRGLHFIGTTTLFIWLMLAIAQRNPKFLIGALISPYAWAWLGHFGVEKNRPATFKYPLKSLISDFKMYFLMWRGRMGKEVARYIEDEE